MAKKAPLNFTYNELNKLSSLQEGALIIGLLLSILIIISDKFGSDFSITLNSVNAILAILYFILSIVLNYLFHHVENKRRDDFFDNSLDTNISEENSEEFFTNEDIEYGTKKLGINCFENSFFTHFISGKMIRPMSIKLFILIVLYLFIFLSADTKTIATVLQFAFPLVLIQKTVRLIIFRNQIEQVLNRFNTIFTSVTKTKQNQLIISNVISYESIISWGGILLSTKKFNKHNTELSKKWDQLKEDKGLKSA